jgi:hypothetical protein
MRMGMSVSMGMRMRMRMSMRMRMRMGNADINTYASAYGSACQRLGCNLDVHARTHACAYVHARPR